MEEIDENVDQYDDWDDEEYEGENDEIVRAKWSFDGATTLQEAAEMLRSYADGLEKLHKDGWVLRGPIEDDYGFIYLDNGPVDRV